MQIKILSGNDALPMEIMSDCAALKPELKKKFNTNQKWLEGFIASVHGQSDHTRFSSSFVTK